MLKMRCEHPHEEKKIGVLCVFFERTKKVRKNQKQKEQPEQL